MPFPIQRIQTDRGQEFFAYEVQERLHEEVNEKYDPSKEHILIHGYNKNLATKY